MHSKKQLGRVMAAVLLSGLISTPATAVQLDLEMLERGRVHQNVAEGGRFEFAKGPMIYQPESDENFSKGYRPESMEYIRGDLFREIHDLPAHVRSYGVFTDIVESLTGSGFDELYSCEREQCGESAAWRLYLSSLIGGRDGTQYYFAGVSGDRSYVAVYVNELGGQTRVLVDHMLMRVADASTVAEVDFTAPFFSSGSAQLSPSSIRGLAALAERIRSEDQDKSLMLIGHADTNGGLLRNLLLSGARAQAVERALIREYQIAPSKLSVAAYGYALPQASLRVGVAATGNRRVEARIISKVMEPVAAAEAELDVVVN